MEESGEDFKRFFDHEGTGIIEGKKHGSLNRSPGLEIR